MSNLKKSQIAHFKPKKGLRTSPSLIYMYLSTPPGFAPFICNPLKFVYKGTITTHITDISKLFHTGPPEDLFELEL